MRRLAQSVQCALEVADHLGPTLLISLQLLYANFLLQLSVEERRLDVQLVQLQVALRDPRQRRVLAHRGVDFLKVKFWFLQVSFCL